MYISIKASARGIKSLYRYMGAFDLALAQYRFNKLPVGTCRRYQDVGAGYRA